MAFPGGRQEPQDPDLLTTSIRETAEEVGVTLSADDVIGRLDDSISPSTKTPRLVISAFVFAIHQPDPPMALSPAEVASAHWFNLTRFLEAEGRTTMTFEWKEREVILPAVYLDDAHIWGLTLGFLDNLVARLQD